MTDTTLDETQTIRSIIKKLRDLPTTDARGRVLQYVNGVVGAEIASEQKVAWEEARAKQQAAGHSDPVAAARANFQA